MRPYGCDDAELVDRARDGDKDAFAELIRRHREVAYRLAERMLANADLAADAAQEACVVAMLSLDRLRTPGRFGPWLCGIALNIARPPHAARTTGVAVGPPYRRPGAPAG